VFSPNPIRPATKTLAEAAYTSYSEATGGKNFQGDPMPTWDQLPQPIRNAWALAAERIRNDVLVPLGTGA
jgi:hypothetical protein